MTESWFVMASEWVTEGNISEFMKANPNVDPSLGLVRFLSAILNLACYRGSHEYRSLGASLTD